MQRLLKRLIVVLILAGAGYLVWQERHRLAPLTNHNIRIQGTWYLWEMNRKGFEPYLFEEKIILRDGTEWGSYEIRMHSRLEVMIGDRYSEYHLEFPDEGTMVWSEERDGRLVPAVEWRR
jgi:hypothetical protein